ncbi:MULTISPECIES: endonuclease/exonuclease/phosphatase family protein [Pacificibacter]|uniref:endonuclease/exonuclease/phosphatase family protein n=1 Tax=Pacificibacter TaxID=1042323 RepID=UPI0020907C74|nr:MULTISPECIES: endonuclease/exonuclease/phosphatase family protein [Pacificibacter]MDO6614105.1 endonuclease/exonuclease/phosphatase family protein [Pacificibacter sp. 1_MG-2023]
MAISNSPQAARTEMRLASYNLRKCRGTDGRRAPGRILDVINGIDADVVALQEADMRLGARPAALPHRMIDTHTDFTAVPVSASSVSVGWHGNAILVRKSAIVDAVHRLDLPGLEPRGAVAVDLENMRVVAVHLGLLRSYRQKQLHAIRAALAKMALKPTVILGDFNEWSRTGGLDPLKDAFDIIAPGKSFHAARPVAALDRIALDDALELRDAGVVETDLSRRASDHLPIWADISIRPQKKPL